MSALSRLAAASLLCCIAASAQASVVQTGSISGVVIGSQTFDVSFFEDTDGFTSFDDVFGTGSPTLTFTTNTDSLAAATAARTAALGLGLNVSPYSNGIGAGNGFIVPWEYDSSYFSFSTGWMGGLFNGVFGNFAQARSGDNFLAYAKFSPTPDVVGTPEPGALGLLALGLGGLVSARRRRN